MVIVDTALEKRARENNPIRVALIGAGYMGRGIALEIITAMAGMRLVAVSNRHVGEAERAYKAAGVDTVERVETVQQVEEVIARGGYAVTDDAMLLCRAENVEAVIDATGEVEFGRMLSWRRFVTASMSS